MNKKLQLAVLASMLLAGCQTLTSQNEVATDDQPTMQTAPSARSALDRSAEDARLTVWQRASQSMQMEIPSRPMSSPTGIGT